MPKSKLSYRILSCANWLLIGCATGLLFGCADFNRQYSVCQESKMTPEEYQACKQDERRGPRSRKGLGAVPGGNPGIP